MCEIPFLERIIETSSIGLMPGKNNSSGNEDTV
jgi:hypothetical protein